MSFQFPPCDCEDFKHDGIHVETCLYYYTALRFSMTTNSCCPKCYFFTNSVGCLNSYCECYQCQTQKSPEKEDLNGKSPEPRMDTVPQGDYIISIIEQIDMCLSATNPRDQLKRYLSTMLERREDATYQPGFKLGIDKKFQDDRAQKAYDRGVVSERARILEVIEGMKKYTGKHNGAHIWISDGFCHGCGVRLTPKQLEEEFGWNAALSTLRGAVVGKSDGQILTREDI